MIASAGAMIADASLPITAMIAGPVLLYGTFVTSMPAITLKISKPSSTGPPPSPA
jgi:hypothetical protein